MIKNVDWSDFKTFIDDRNLNHQMISLSKDYILMAKDDWFGFQCVLPKDGGTDQTDYETNYLSLANKSLQTRTPAGTPLVTSKKADGTSFSRVSHDFTDKTTWYQESTQVTGETLTGSGVGPYSFANNNIIDVEIGRAHV